MRYAILFLYQAIAVSNGLPPTVDDEYKQLEGQWKIVKVEGGQLPKKTEDRVVRIKRESIIFGTKKAVDIKIDSTKMPKWIDVKFDKSMPASLGIYEIKDDRLKMYIETEFDSDKPPSRPATFDGQLPGQIYYLERITIK